MTKCRKCKNDLNGSRMWCKNCRERHNKERYDPPELKKFDGDYLAYCLEYADKMTYLCIQCDRWLPESKYHKFRALNCVDCFTNYDIIMEYVNEYKVKIGCKECGYNKKPNLLHFHHIDPKTKIDNIGDMIKDDKNFQNIVKEIDKCELLCSDCHIKKHGFNLHNPRCLS